MRDLHKVIQTIRLTEKATLLGENNNEYVFKVDPQATKIDIKQDANALTTLAAGAKLTDVVRVLNTLGATPGDLVAILQAMTAAGALRAEIEII